MGAHACHCAALVRGTRASAWAQPGFTAPSTAKGSRGRAQSALPVRLGGP